MPSVKPVLVVAGVVTLGALAVAASVGTGFAAEVSAKPGAAAGHAAAKTGAAKKSPVTPCDAFQLEARAAELEPGVGSVTSEVSIKNINVKDSCSIPGSLIGSIVDTKGKVLAKTASAGSATVVLVPLGTATLDFKTLNGGVNLPAGQKCTGLGRLELTLPGKPRHSDLPVEGAEKFQSCGGIQLSALTAG